MMGTTTVTEAPKARAERPRRPALGIGRFGEARP
jgi:hypothetical protein